MNTDINVIFQPSRKTKPERPSDLSSSVFIRVHPWLNYSLAACIRLRNTLCKWLYLNRSGSDLRATQVPQGRLTAHFPRTPFRQFFICVYLGPSVVEILFVEWLRLSPLPCPIPSMANRNHQKVAKIFRCAPGSCHKCVSR